MSDGVTGFTAGFAARHAAAAEMLQAAFAPPAGFLARDPRERAYGRRATDPLNPQHFSPADPTARSNDSWHADNNGAENRQFVDPVAAAHAAGYAEGVAAAELAAQQSLARDQALLIDLAAALQQGSGFDRDAMARQLRQTVVFLVDKLVGETGVSAEVLAARIEAATDLLADGAESALLRVHPDDVALLEGKLPKN